MAFLAVPQPYDFERSTERFRAFGPDLANLWHDGGLHRVVAGRELRIGPAAGGVDVEPLDDQTRPVVRKLLGLDFELGPFYDWAAQRPILAALVRRLEGFRPPLAPDPFESLVTSITAQQVSMQSAFAIRNRMIERFGERTGRAYAFPMRETIARASEAELVALGFSRRKTEYVVGLARADIDFDALSGLEDDAIRSRLTAVRGLGPWSAEWFLARHLARPRAWPAGDLALRKAADVLYGLDVRELGRRLDPFQNLSAHYLLFGLRAAAAA
jgi:3-methyladenine DNA glycosylase/8-oxoguanine DNA glycosylase